MGKEPWYSEGLQFECTGCGDCCTGAPGFVWVNDEEMRQLADAIGEPDVDEFERLYTRRVGLRLSLREFPNGDCVFFDSESRACTVYEARPIQCRTWPFWDSNLDKKSDWKRTCRDCPGSGTGLLYSLEEIETRRTQIKI